jgi:hypothetical protein
MIDERKLRKVLDRIATALEALAHIEAPAKPGRTRPARVGSGRLRSPAAMTTEELLAELRASPTEAPRIKVQA